MTSIGKIYGYKAHAKVSRSLAAAKINGVELELVKCIVLEGDGQKPEYKAKFPLGRIPGFEGTDGTKLIEGRAIARHVASVSDNSKLLGTDKKSEAEVEQWISFADEEIFNQAGNLLQFYFGRIPYNKVAETKYWDRLHAALAFLDAHLQKQTFIVGHRITLADLTLVSDLQFAYLRVAGKEVQEKYPNVARYYQTITNQPAILDVYAGNGDLLTENAKYVPPKKEPKAAAPAAAAAAGAAGAAGAAAAAPAAAKKADKKKDADDEDDDGIPKPAPAPKHPCASLPPSPFIIDEAKRNYSNWDTPDFLKWFYENFDKQGWSIWRFDFKYNEELSMVFMSANQIGGFFDRLEASRKFVMGAGGVYGEDKNSKIAGAIIIRGNDPQVVLGVAPDLESYAVTPLDPFNKAEDKKFFEENLAWEGEIDGLKFNQGKFLK